MHRIQWRILEELGKPNVPEWGMHGWELMQAVPCLGPTLYRHLEVLEDRHWVIANWPEDFPADNRPPETPEGKDRHRYYRLSPDGRQERAAEMARRRSASASLATKPVPETS